MRKLTRRSYNRKLIMLGLALFLSVGLISTGFSAWLISSVNGKNATDDLVDVGTISADSVEVTIDQWYKAENEQAEDWHGEIIRFDAADGDSTGRVVHQEEGDLVENLDMPITGIVTNYSKVKTMVLEIKLPESLTAAIEAKYIALDLTNGTEASTDDATYEVKTESEKKYGYITIDLKNMISDNTDTAEDTTDGKFAYALKFAWGDYFKNVNPSVFYDSDEYSVNRGTENASITGKAIPDDQVKDEMYAFRKVLTGNASDDGKQPYEGTISITITPTI